jgi:DNA-binding NarL/FixJ family response regulator
MSAGTCKVLIVDDHPLVLQGLRDILAADPSFEVVGTCGAFQETLVALSELRPDIALFDLHLKDGNGFDLTRAVKARWPHLKVVIISAQDEQTCAGWSLQCGADGMVSKTAEPRQIREILHKVWLGQLGFREETHYWLIRSMRGELSQGIHRLTPREFTVFLQMGYGKNSKEIAQEMSVSPRTVETYHRNIREKLGVPHHDALIRLATMLFTSGETSSHIEAETSLLRDFESRALAWDEWTHRKFLLVAFIYLSRYPFAAALGKLSNGLEALYRSHGASAQYNETFCVAYAHHLRSLLDTSPFWLHGAAFLTAHPELEGPERLAPLWRYYSPERLDSEEARAGFITPDRAPLPVPVEPS